MFQKVFKQLIKIRQKSENAMDIAPTAINFSKCEMPDDSFIDSVHFYIYVVCGKTQKLGTYCGTQDLG